MLGFKNKTAPTALPVLPVVDNHPRVVEVLSRFNRISADYAAALRESEAATASVVEEFGPLALQMSDDEIEAHRIASPATDSAANRRWRLVERARSLAAHVGPRAMAVRIVSEELQAAREQARRELVPGVFREVYRPALQAAGAKLIEAARALKELRALQTHIGRADLLTGANTAMPFLLDALLNGPLDPEKIVQDLADAGALTPSEADAMKRAA